MPRKKRNVMPPHLRMTTLDEFLKVKTRTQRQPDMAELAEKYRRRTMETQHGLEARKQSFTE